MSKKLAIIDKIYFGKSPFSKNWSKPFWLSPFPLKSLRT